MEAKIFQSGNSQAVRIPKEFRFDVTEVEIFKRGDELVLKPRPKNLGVAFKLLGQMPNDFMANGREDSNPQERESF
ncbi:MAG: antitoxin [Thiomicrospira sp. CG2_30_44_34]|nr:MAG: antitoxin [Thiomicrospira sp. CG2_30_44_34]